MALLALAFLGGYQSAVTALAGKFGAQYIAVEGLAGRLSSFWMFLTVTLDFSVPAIFMLQRGDNIITNAIDIHVVDDETVRCSGVYTSLPNPTHAIHGLFWRCMLLRSSLGSYSRYRSSSASLRVSA